MMRPSAAAPGPTMRLPVLLSWLLAFAAATAVHAQPQPASPGYVIRALDGDQVLGEHFAVVPPVSTGTWVGFYYLADEQRLWVAGCSGTSCAPTRAINASGDRGAYVSAAVRPAPSNLPIVAYYDVANGDLRLTACIDLNCSLSSVERTLDAAGDVGAGTAIAVDPAFHGYGELYWLDAEGGNLAGAVASYRRLAVALDTGGAIKGAVRADLYLGRGEAAGTEAGRVRHPLRMWKLVPVS